MTIPVTKSKVSPSTFCVEAHLRHLQALCEYSLQGQMDPRAFLNLSVLRYSQMQEKVTNSEYDHRR